MCAREPRTENDARTPIRSLRADACPGPERPPASIFGPGGRAQIAVVIKQLSDQYKIKDRELQEFQRKNNIVVAGENPPSSQSSARKASGQGVLA